jgi:hypothetical protein
MPNINVKDVNIENGSNQIVGDPFEVTVVVNNRETISFPDTWWAPEQTSCSYPLSNGTTIGGHRATVEVTILKDGVTVDSQSEDICAPIDSPTVPDPRVRFTFELSDPGVYDVRSTVKPAERGAPSTVTRTITVSQTGEQPLADNDGGDSPNSDWDWDWDGDGESDLPGGGGLVDGETKILIGIVLVIILLGIARPYAGLAENVTG